MALVEAKHFWGIGLELGDNTHPPDTWTLIDCQYPFDDHELARWLKSDEASGEYCWHFRRYLRGDSSDGATWAFSDHRTAMAFKLRFG